MKRILILLLFECIDCVLWRDGMGGGRLDDFLVVLAKE